MFALEIDIQVLLDCHYQTEINTLLYNIRRRTSFGSRVYLLSKYREVTKIDNKPGERKRCSKVI